MWQKVPYTNFQDLNLDYLLNKVKELNDYIYTTLETVVGSEAKKFFESYAFDYLYVEETETIKFVGKVGE